MPTFKPAVIKINITDSKDTKDAGQVAVEFDGGTIPIPAIIVSLQMILQKLEGMEPVPGDIKKTDIN